MNTFNKFQPLFFSGLLSLAFALPANAATTLQDNINASIEIIDKIALAHARKKQSTGSWKGNRDVHQNLPKGRKEVKRESDGWVQRQGKKPNGNAAKRNSRSTSK